MHTLFERPGFTILHDTDNCWLYVLWRGTRSNQSSVACCQAIVEQVRATGSTKILNDGSLDLDGWSALVEWVGQDFFDLLAASGVVAVAWVMPHDLRALTDVHKVLAVVTRPIVSTFADAEGACSWLTRAPGIRHQPVSY